MGVAGWQLEVHSDDQDRHTVHHADMAHHHDRHHASDHDDLDDHHHHYCQSSLGSLALFTAIPTLSFIETTEAVSGFVAQPYLEPLIDLPIRPPIA